MTQTSPYSYLQKYEQKRDSRSANRSQSKQPQSNIIDGQISSITLYNKLEQKVNGLQVKVGSLVNVVKLLQKYTETRDDQYEKQKQNDLYKKVAQGNDKPVANIEGKVKQFEILTKTMKQQLKQVQKIKSKLVLTQATSSKQSNSIRFQQIQQRLREEINKKIQVCLKIINNSRSQKDKNQKINQIAFNLNQLQNQCRRSRMMFQKDIDSLTALLKHTRPDNSRITVNNHKQDQQSPFKARSKSKSRSEHSLSRGKQNKSGATIVIGKQLTRQRDQQLKEALRKKKEHRQKIKAGF